MTERPELTHDKLVSMLRYDPETGSFSWINERKGKGSGRKKAAAGSKHNRGYVSIRIDYELYLAHRLAWFYMTGEWPPQQIDHRDGVRSNNKWRNLREADNCLNAENQRQAQATNLSGLLGVSQNHDRWSAVIQVKGKRRYLGTFDTAMQAHAAYIEAKRSLHVGCTV